MKNRMIVSGFVFASWFSFSSLTATAASIDRPANSDFEAVPNVVTSAFPKLEGFVEVTVEAPKYSTVVSETTGAMQDSRQKPDHSFAYVVNDVDKNYETAFRQSECILVCEYRGYKKDDNIGFYNPPAANYQLIKCLKGPCPNGRIYVKFDFADDPLATISGDWKFSDEKMPKVGSQWIIFIPNAVASAQGFETFKGSYGRQEASEDNLAKLYAIIEAHHGQIGIGPDMFGGGRIPGDYFNR